MNGRRVGIVPMKAVAGQLPDSDDGWAYEVKWDGYRALAFVEAGAVRFQSTNLLDLTDRWPTLAGLAGSVNAETAVLDGEVVVFDETGSSRFELLQQNTSPVTFVVFDVLSINGTDTTSLSYEQRRALLAQLVEPAAGWIVPEHHVGGGAALAESTQRQGLEGIMAKRLDSRYLIGKRSSAWRKVKHRRQQEFVIGGWTAGNGARAASFGALLLGYRSDGSPEAPLRFAGAVGTGFGAALISQLMPRLIGGQTLTSAFDPMPPREVVRDATWVSPSLVCQVAFAEWTSEGLLRHPSFLGLRDDVDWRDVRREPN